MRFVIIAFLFACSFGVSAETVNLNNSSVRSFVQWYSSKTGKAVIVNLIQSAMMTRHRILLPINARSRQRFRLRMVRRCYLVA